MAFTAVIALAEAAAVEVTAAMVFAAVAEVGVAMSIAGAVTGSEDLSKIGGVLSIVGGVGSWATGLSGSAAGGLGEVVDATGGLETATNYAGGFGEAIDATGGLETATNYAEPSSFSDASSLAATSSVPQDLNQAMPDYADALGQAQPPGIGQEPGIVNNAVTPSVQTPTVDVPGTTPDTQFNTNDAISGDNGIGNPATNGPASNPDGSMRTSADDRLGKINSNIAPKVPGSTGTEKVGFGKFFEDISKFAKNNKDLIQMGGYMMQGIQKQSEVDARIKLQNRQLDLVSHGNAVPTYNYASNVMKNPGIINAARGG